MTAPTRSAKSAKAIGLLTLLSVLVSLALAWAANAAPTPSAPTITAKPPTATPASTATFEFTTSGSGITYQCSLDTAAFAACTSPKTYSGLAQGSHTFRVKAITGGKESSITSYTWVVDWVAPPVPTIVGKPASLSTTASPSFVFTDAESGVGFLCRLDGGLSAPCSSPKGYFNLAQGAHTFEVQAVDAAGNTSAAAGYAWSIDSIAPDAPVFTDKPSDPASSAISTFAWTASEAGLRFECNVDQSNVWDACTSPHTTTVSTSSSEMHQFRVVAIDAAGNRSPVTTYQWKLADIGFTVTGGADGLLAPGISRSLALTIRNDQNFPIYVTGLTVTATGSPAGCAASTNLQITPSPISDGQRFTVPTKSSAALPAALRPRVMLRNLPVNQDACKRGTFTFEYSGSATK
jgi:hypothetical protein